MAKVDITPPADTPVVGHVRPTNGVRDPLRAGILLIANEQTQAAIVTVDLIDAPTEMVEMLRDAISQGQEHLLRMCWWQPHIIIQGGLGP